MSEFYGQAWISGDSLVQEIITFNSTTRDTTTTTKVIVANIWDCLLEAGERLDSIPSSTTPATQDYPDPEHNNYYVVYSDPGRQKPFFFWKVKQTPIEEGASPIWITFACPEPKPGLFIPPYDLETEYTQFDDNDDTFHYNDPYFYPNYWIKKLKAASDNYQNSSIIQRGTVVFDGCSYIGPRTPGTNTTDPETGVITTDDPNIYSDPNAKVDPYTFENDDLGDITNLLRLF